VIPPFVVTWKQGDADCLLLEKVPRTDKARYDSGNSQGCLRGTRVDVLLQLEFWLKDEGDHRVFWLNGLAGTGKSTIARTFAEISFAEGKLGASFFCSRDFEDRSNLQAIFPTLAFQLAYRYLPFREKLLRVLRANPGVGQDSLCSQMEKIIVGPLKATRIRTLIIIDALDECKDEEPASAILSILSRYVDEIPNVKFFITGRPEPRIRSGFRLESLTPVTEVLKLHEVKPEVVDGDIKLFFRTQLTRLAKNRSDCDVTEVWPSLSDIKILCKKAAGFFIYASTVVKFVASENNPPVKRLILITSLPESTVEEGRSGIDQLYTKVLEHALHTIHTDNSQHLSCFQAAVGAVVLVFNPLSIKGLSELLGYDVSDIRSTIRSLHSLLLVPDSTEDPVLTFHKSFPDFLTDPDRCKDDRFFVEPAVHHTEILLLCLKLMRERLKKNICNLDDHSVLSEVKDLSALCKNHIGDALEYSCCFWTKHLLRVPGSISCVKEVEKGINEFFTTCLPHWIEVLALTRNLGAGVYAMNDVEQWCTLVSVLQFCLLSPLLICTQAGVVCQWTTDSQRLILEHFDMICNSPTYIYYFALPISPSSSWLHQYYSAEFSQEIRVVKGLSAGWGTCFRTVQFNDFPRALTCWKDTIAVGKQSGSIIILNATTGIQVAILSGHTEYVNSLVFSSDGASLVSGSGDKTIKLWDVQTGGVVKTFQGHTRYVYASISADNTTIASGSIDKTIRLWDIQTGECHHTVEQKSFVDYVHFFPLDPKHFMSVSAGKIQKWDTSGQKFTSVYEGSRIAFSPDGIQFVVCNEAIVEVHSSDSGGTLAKFNMGDKYVDCCCTSPDNRVVAVGAGHTIYVWDITGSEPYLFDTFSGHTGDILSLVFSSPSSLISASIDCSVKFWQIGTSSTDPVPADPVCTPSTSALIKSINLQAEYGIAISSHSDGTVRIWDIQTGLNKESFQTPAKGCYQMDTYRTDSGLIFVWYGGKKIYISGTRVETFRTVDTPEGNILDLRISGDGSQVFCLYKDFIKAWSISTGDHMAEVKINCHLPFDSFLTINGPKAWLFSMGWDFRILGSPPVKLSNIYQDFPHLYFIGGVRQQKSLIPGIQDTITKKVVFQLPGRLAKCSDAQWDGHYLVAGYDSGEVLILKCNRRHWYL